MQGCIIVRTVAPMLLYGVIAGIVIGYPAWAHAFSRAAELPGDEAFRNMLK